MSSTVAERSPWEAALGDRVALLHPRLSEYFSRIPDGFVGRGDGVFDHVGTPRRWLWPVLAILARQGVLFAVWERSVPFTVINRPRGAWVDAVRIFRFRSGTRVMVDSITSARGLVIDALGFGGAIRTALVPDVVDGALVLRSTAAGIRIGRLRVRLPGPTVRLTEQFDDTVSRQRVRLELRVPLIGRIYEYSGTFQYEVVPE